MLEIVDLSFRYTPKSEPLFSGLNHRFARGSFTALTGPSGKGKSTLLYLIGLLLTPTAGWVSFNGENVSGLSDAQRSQLRAEHLGFVFQDSALDPTRNILDAVIEPALYAGWQRSKAQKRALELLERLGVAHRAHHRPGEISGGQAQRVAVCRALVNNPDIVLADEPTGNLDRDNAAVVLEALRNLDQHRNRTIIIATHDPFVLEHVDEVFEL